MRTCQFCAEEVKAEAIVCKHCNRDIRPGSPSGRVDRYPLGQPKQRSLGKVGPSRLLVLTAIAIVAVGVLLTSAFESESVAAPRFVNPPPRPPSVIEIASTSDLDVAAGKFLQFDWRVPEDQPNCHLTGRVEVVGGGSKDVRLFVTTADEFKNLSNGHEFRAYLTTDRVTVVNLDLRISQPGAKVLALSNIFSLFTSKRVQLRNVRATCT